MYFAVMSKQSLIKILCLIIYCLNLVLAL